MATGAFGLRYQRIRDVQTQSQVSQVNQSITEITDSAAGAELVMMQFGSLVQNFFALVSAEKQGVNPKDRK